MEFSAFFIFEVFTASMTYLTFGKERERAVLFPDYYFYAERRLVNHTIEEEYVKNLDECELLCYQNDNCVSLNYKKDPENNLTYNEPVHICNLNNATHLKYDGDLTTDGNFYYRGSKNACDRNQACQNSAICQSGFTHKGYRCVCPPGFKGEHCGEDINECETPKKCHANATCNNIHGSHLCTCKPGYTGDGQNCTDIDECRGNHSCHVNATCRNTLGSHVCKCHPGYTGNGKNCTADPCHDYKDLNDSDRNSSIKGNLILCDKELPNGWYRFMGAAGTKMPTARVEPNHCGTRFSGWLDGVHPRVEHGEVTMKVCFSGLYRKCRDTTNILVKNCGSYYIYRHLGIQSCPRRYCGTE